VTFQLLAAPPPQPGPVNLDRVEAEAGQFAAGGWVRTYVPPLVNEARAAREREDELWAGSEFVAAFKAWQQRQEDGSWQRVLDALAAYDRAVSEP
jgi:hypothetical protein